MGALEGKLQGCNSTPANPSNQKTHSNISFQSYNSKKKFSVRLTEKSCPYGNCLDGDTEID